MPDVNGWEIQPSYRPQIWHADCDSYITNNPSSRAEHLKVCREMQATAKRQAEAARRREAGKVLRRINRLRAESRKVT